MAENYEKIISAFYAAKQVHHYYWMHTDGDDYRTGRVSIENIQKIIELLTGIQIQKRLVHFEGRFHRAFIERFDGGERCVINVLNSESEPWRRFATVKELCHLLVDTPGDFQPDPRKTIEAVTDESFPFHERSASEADSEALAEWIALELIYPLEMRRDDAALIESGSSLEEIGAKREIPTKYVSIGTAKSHLEACEKIWKHLPQTEPPNLDDLLN